MEKGDYYVILEHAVLPEKGDYYVVLEHAVLPEKGDPIKTMHWFKDKDQFKEWYSNFKDVHSIVAEGISMEKAIKLSDCIDIKSPFAESILNQGKVNKNKR